MQTEYPQYYRKDGKCLRVDSPTECWAIILPPDSRVALRDHIIYPSPDRLLVELASMEPVDADCFRSFYSTFIDCVLKEASPEKRLVA